MVKNRLITPLSEDAVPSAEVV